MIVVFTAVQVYVLPPMPDKPNTPFTLADHRLVALRGPDAVRFAHAQFMSDVAVLPDGEWQWSGWLTPKGRVVALFALLRLDAERLWLLLPDADPEEFAAQLRRYVFRSKVMVEPRPDLAVAGAFTADPEARGATLALRGAESVALDVGGDGGARTLWISADAPAANDSQPVAAWRAYDVAHGLPRLDAGQADRWTPQQLSLERLRAFSVKKGCYPGQEIVARTHFLGKAKRGLALLEADVPPASGSEVFDGERAIGHVVSMASADGRHLALAVLPLERDPSPLEIDGKTVLNVPLLDGLAR